MIIVLIIVVLFLIILASISLKIVRPFEKGLVERLGKFHRIAEQDLIS